EEQIKSHEKTLYDILMEEPQLSFDDEEKATIKEFLIGNIDDDGYLLCSIEEVADQLEVPEGTVEEVLNCIQEAAPPGVGARNPQEALVLQIKHDLDDEEDRKIAISLVMEHYQNLKRRKIGEVAQNLNVSTEKISELWDRIAKYSLSPGANYAPKADYITPEIQVRTLGDQLQVLPLRDGIPNIIINQEYAQILKDNHEDDETSNYLKDKMQEAKWLIRAIDQRKKNMMRIVTEVSKIQAEFFKGPTTEIKPLTLKDIADKLRLSPSTISRAINSKYVLTSKGTYPLKHFFTGGFSNGKTMVSNLTVREMVKDICAKGCLTDKEIADEIGKQLSIRLSRRAVAQYRNDMGIPSSLERKKRLSKE
ncbi:MAG TPA: RNA polymerase factor sigma-54, partial [Caldisericia bacterium]|nr:RNA polymerase factor sigma-54 [Caldisericia bacterium]